VFGDEGVVRFERPAGGVRAGAVGKDDAVGDVLPSVVVDHCPRGSACPEFLDQHPARGFGHRLGFGQGADGIREPDEELVQLDRAIPRPRQLQLPADTRGQLARRERLDDVIVRAGDEPLDRRLLARASRQEHDWY
jgi:hypothetical protein